MKGEENTNNAGRHAEKTRNCLTSHSVCVRTQFESAVETAAALNNKLYVLWLIGNSRLVMWTGRRRREALSVSFGPLSTLDGLFIWWVRAAD